MIENRKNSRIVSMLAAIFIAAMFLTSSMVVFADSSDEEPNDDFWDAVYCYDGDYIYGSLDDSSDPDDYYQIWLNDGDFISLTLTGTGDNFDLYLYDPYEWEVDSSWNFGSTETISYTTTDSGYHYILVSAISGSGSYSLYIAVTEGSGGSTGDSLWVGGDPYVTGDPIAEVPTLTVGNGAYWGGVKDIGEEMEAELDQALTEFENMGFDVSYDINGGAGVYFGIEVASNSASVNGITCYDIALTGAVAIDVGLSASVDGSVTESGYTISMDGSGSGFVELEVNLDGHLFLTVDELAIAKITLTLTAEGHGELDLQADMSMQGISQSIDADGSMDIDGAQIDFDLAFDPPLDIYQFPMWEGKEWYVPGFDTDVSGSLNAQGTISYDMHARVPGEDPIDESQTVNLATEIGDNNFQDTIPGGVPDWGYYDGGALFTCAYAGGDIFIIETELGDAFGYLDLGTRQFGIPDVEGMVPSTGLQYNGQTGMITGMTMGGEVMTETVSASDVEAFTEDPLGEVVDVTGGHSSGIGAGLLAVILIGVIIIVVVIVVVVMLTKKKTPPQQQYPQQGYYQQPPPPPPEYQPQQQDQYQQPPPPPPPGY